MARPNSKRGLKMAFGLLGVNYYRFLMISNFNKRCLGNIKKMCYLQMCNILKYQLHANCNVFQVDFIV
jgi:hypothetical protein